MHTIDILIPAYNAEKYIETTLKSCLNQTYKNFGIIIINDGSTDSTLNILNRIHSDNLKIVTTPNKGLVASRKKGIEISKAEYIFFLDSDDTLPSDALQVLVNAMGNKSPDLVLGAMHVITETNKTIHLYVPNEEITKNLAGSIISKRYVGSLCGRLIKRELLLNLNVPNDITTGEDIVANLQLLKNNPKIVYTNSIVYNYIQHSGSMINRYGLSIAIQRKKYVLWVMNYCKKSHTTTNEKDFQIFIKTEYFSFLKDGGIPKLFPEATSLMIDYQKRRVLSCGLPYWRYFMILLFIKNEMLGNAYRTIFRIIRNIFR